MLLSSSFMFFAFLSCLQAASLPSSTSSSLNSPSTAKNSSNSSNSSVGLRFGGDTPEIIHRKKTSRGNKPVVATKFSSDVTIECKCIPYYDCDKKYVSEGEGTPPCDSDEKVCCTKPPTESVFQPTPAAVPDSGHTDNNGKPCTCVALDKCPNEAYASDYGAGVVQIRISPCETSEVCCPNEFLNKEKQNYHVSTEEPPCTPETDSGFSNANSQPDFSKPTEPIPYEKPEDNKPENKNSEPECACVSTELCKKSTIDSQYGGTIIQVRSPFCDTSEVCCPLDSLLHAPKVTVPEVTDDANNYIPKTYECGIRKIHTGTETRIVGIEDYSAFTHFGEFPWMIIIMKKDEQGNPILLCGGSLVAANVVLTAAHCVSTINKEDLIVRAGEYDVKMEADHEEAPHQDRYVIDISIHPFYRSDVVFNDMALLQLSEEFKMKPHIYPVCLPTNESVWADPKIYNPNKCIATGWGKDAFGKEGSLQRTLKKVDLAIVEREECVKKLRESRLGPKFKLHSSFICAGGEQGKDTCKGDGGGPLFCEVIDKPGRYVQVGIVSWGIGCGNAYPAVYASLYANMKWLTYELQTRDNKLYDHINGLWKEYNTAVRSSSP